MPVHGFSYRETRFRIVNGGLKQFAPGQTTEFAMHLIPAIHGAGDRYAVDAHLWHPHVPLLLQKLKRQLRRSRSARINACSTPVSGMRIMNSSPP